MRKPEIHFPTIFGVLIAAVGLITGVVLLRNPLSVLVGASPEEAPQKTQITNISDSEFVVSWVTSKAAAGFVQYGQGTNPDLVVSDDRDQDAGNVGSYYTHFVTVRGLAPSSTYSFRIGSGKKLYDKDGQPYSISTGPTLNNTPTADIAYGQVNNSTGEAADGAIVYLHLPGVVPQASLVKATGSWVIPLATSRTTDLTSFAPYDPATANLEIFVEGGPMGVTQTTVTTADDKPVSSLILGVGADQISITNSTPSPTIDPNLPSKFTGEVVAPATESASEANLAILTPKFAEQVNDQAPEIIGTAPAHAEVQIEIHSDEVLTGTVVADASGNWSYSVPTNLAPGEHTITISTLINGVVKKVTRSFVVSAAGESNTPSFTATASATLAPTKTPTSTPIPTLTIVVTSTPKPTLAPRVAYPSTESGVPTSGNLTPTLLLAILGLGLVVVGLFSYKLKFD